MGRCIVDKVVIRPVTEADEAAIAKLWTSLVAYHQHLDAALPGATEDGPRRYAGRLISRLSDPYTRAFIAEDDGRPVGYILGMVVDMMQDMFDQQVGGFLADIYVDPAYRRQGVGRGLVDALADWFRQSGVTHFEWHVAARNPAGIAFWHAIGGREVMIRMRAEIKDEP
jgi:ribosomal protein S18 acetylase RimI-like enzyme